MKKLIQLSVALIAMMAAGAAGGQEVVHAMTGKVVSVDPKAKMFVMTPDDGSSGQFRLPAKEVPLDFDRNVKARTVPAATFSKTGTQVLLYYIGFGDDKTAVAVQDLGSGSLVKVVGAVVKYDKHAHELTIKTDKGVQEKFAFDGNTVAEGSEGAQEGEKFHPDGGMQVRVVAAAWSGKGEPTALFVRSLTL